MKRILIGAAAICAIFTTPTYAADVGVSVSIGQPGFYGRIDIGDFPYPYPRVIYHQPRIIEHVYVEREPIYMRVPPGHAKNWRKHCHQYGACGERVYFVQDNWYHHDYVPHYQEYHRDRHDEWRGDRRDEWRGVHRGDHEKHRSENRHGRGHGRDR